MKNSVVTARAPVTISVKTTTTARPAETTSKKSTKIKWTYNGVSKRLLQALGLFDF